MENKNLNIVLIIVIIVALGLVTYWFIKRGQQTTPGVLEESTPTVPGPVVPGEVSPTPTLPGEIQTPTPSGQ